MLLSLLLLPACITLDNNDCADQQYLALNGDCIQDPGPTDIELDTAEPDVDEGTGDGGDGGTDDGGGGTTGGGETGDGGTTGADDAGADGGNTDGSGGEPMLDSADASCDVGSWNYDIATSIPTEGATLTVTDSATGLEEFHTLVTDGPSESGGEKYQRELLLVDGYYFEDVATQFACIDGTNDQLTWKVDLFSDADRTQNIGCVTWGQDTTTNEASGCQLF